MVATASTSQVPTGDLRQLIEELDRTADAELEAVARLAAGLLGMPIASVNAVHGDQMHQLATVGSTAERGPRADSVCVRVGRLTEGLFSSADLSADPRFADSPWVDGRQAAFRGYASAPLTVRGVHVGALCVLDVVPRCFSATGEAGLRDLARLASAILERRDQTRIAARLASDTEQTRQELESTVAELAAAHTELSRTEAFAQGLLEVLPVGVVAVDASGRRVLVNEVTRNWHQAVDGRPVTPESSPTPLFFHPDGVTPLPTGELPLIRSSNGSGIAHTEAVLQHEGRPPRRLSITSSPIHSANGELLGAVAAMTDVTLRWELEDQLRTAALHDGLTGLPNRALIVDRLDHALRTGHRSGEHVAVMFCDLDGFKAVNDTRGHAAGDEVLVEVARRLVRGLRPGDTIGRLGGDEFVLLCPGAATPEATAAIATRVEHSLRAPVVLSSGVRVQVGVSVGVAVSRDGDRPEDVMTRADAGMYAVKEQHHRGPRG